MDILTLYMETIYIIYNIYLLLFITNPNTFTMG